MPANLKNSAVATGLKKISFQSNPKERQCQKCSNYRIIALISHTSKVMLKILQARLQQYMNRESLMFKLALEKAEEPEDGIEMCVGDWSSDVCSSDLNMPANLENSAVATGLEKVSFHSNPKERQCQRMLKLPHNRTHLTRY